MTGIPCCHGVTAIQKDRSRIEDYVHPYYTRDGYLAAYSYMIHPVPDIYEYVQTGLQPLNPPLAKKLGGRPKKARKKQADEPSAKKKGDEQIASRKNLNVTCGKCLQVGHNKRTCKNRLHPKSKMMKVTLCFIFLLYALLFYLYLLQ